MNGLLVVVITFVGSSLLIIGLAIPLCLRRIGPNEYYGFRTRHSMSDEEIWYETNAVCGQWLVAMGGLTLLATIGGWLSGLNTGELSIAGTVAMLVGTLFCTIHPLIVQRRMLDNREFEGSSSDSATESDQQPTD